MTKDKAVDEDNQNKKYTNYLPTLPHEKLKNGAVFKLCLKKLILKVKNSIVYTKFLLLTAIKLIQLQLRNNTF